MSLIDSHYFVDGNNHFFIAEWNFQALWVAVNSANGNTIGVGRFLCVDNVSKNVC